MSEISKGKYDVSEFTCTVSSMNIATQKGNYTPRFFSWSSCPNVSSQEEKRISSNMIKLLANDHSLTRPNITGGPLQLEVGMHIIKFDGISTKKESYESDVYLRMLWRDTRWCHNETEDITISGDPHESIWRPDLYFENALKTDKSEITKYNYFMQIQKDGSIYSSLRASVVGKCPQNVLYFPFDSQHCKMVIESYGYTEKQLNLKWQESHPVIIPNKQLQQFQVSRIKLEKIRATYTSGDFSRLVVHFYLDRHLGYYIIQIYIPCQLVVMLSWLSFWMSPEDVGDRIALGITCLLTLVFLMTSINESLPKVSYAKTIDIYLIGCFMYVLSVAIETVIAKKLSERGDERVEDKKEKEQLNGKVYTCSKCCADKLTVATIRNPTVMTTNFEIFEQADSYSTSTTSTANAGLHYAATKKEGTTTQEQQQQITEKRLKPETRLDKYCKVIYPTLFVILNIVYYIICTRNGKHVD
eukprot:gene20504-22521_t